MVLEKPFCSYHQSVERKQSFQFKTFLRCDFSLLNKKMLRHVYNVSPNISTIKIDRL